MKIGRYGKLQRRSRWRRKIYRRKPVLKEKAERGMRCGGWRSETHGRKQGKRKVKNCRREVENERKEGDSEWKERGLKERWREKGKEEMENGRKD